jgi:hypothetical protein
MSYDGYDDDDDFDSESNPMKALRKENRAKEKQIKELQEQLSTLSKAQRERSLADVLNNRGVNAKVAKFIPEDVTSEEDVASWLDEYGDLFGVQVRQDEAPAEQAENPNAEVLNALSKIANTQNTGQAPTGDQDQIAALIAGARTPEELNKVLFGNANGPAAI